MVKPSDNYDSVNTVAPATSSGDDYLHVQSNPQDMGAQVGAAVEKAGAVTQQVGNQALEEGTQFAKVATEAKVNDDYANKYIPAAVQLRQNFDMLDGQDKVHGYDAYVNGLQDLNKQYTANTKSPYETQLMGGLIDRHIEGEEMGAKRELVESQKQFLATSSAAKIAADSGYAANNYNNPNIVTQASNSNNATVTMAAIDAGHDPNTPDGQAAIQSAQRHAQGQMTIAMLDRAVSAGDVQGAYKIRADYAHVLEGDQQIHYDDILHTQSMQQAGIYGVQALKNGQPLPEVVGNPPAHVQAVIANTAQTAGHDVNDALTVARIESSYGQNVGKIGNIGQNITLPKGATLEQQAQKLVDDKKVANDAASTALGRTASNAEGYVTYQQGTAGGSALLKASDSGSQATAINTLAPLYATKQDPSGMKGAQQAVLNNGGSASMSAGDFVNFLTKKYNDNAKRAAIDVQQPQQVAQADTGTVSDTDVIPGQVSNNPVIPSSTPSSVGDAIMKPHVTTGEVIQPAVSPRQQLMNFDAKYPDMVARANQITNIETRNRVVKALESQRSIVSGAANAYTQKLVNNAEQLMAKPDFNMEQVPPATYSALAVDHPQTLIAMQSRADHIAEHGSGTESKDAKDGGAEWANIVKRVNLPPSDPQAITNSTDLLPYVNNGLTMKGYESVKKLLPQENERKEFMAMGVKQITKSSANLNDGEGDRAAYNWQQATNKYIDEQLASGTKLRDLLDPNNKNYAGNNINIYRQGFNNMVLSQGDVGGTSVPVINKAAPIPRTITMDDINAAAKVYGKTPEQVQKDAVAKGYKIQ